ncbi:glycosyltransferase family 9 protein [Catellatospora bangladeshensis]|uniref:glycosyltransferase family 9 protein n=1 Tax=Catellatospora bangladeshensis TaxID=310355 RepID=UPI003610B138
MRRRRHRRAGRGRADRRGRRGRRGGPRRADRLGRARLLARSACLVVGNTGPAHLAAAVGTPVVSLYAPTVPFARWGPYAVPHVRLGDPDAPCRDSRAVTCTLPGHPCLGAIDPGEVAAAVARLIGSAS